MACQEVIGLEVFLRCLGRALSLRNAGLTGMHEACNGLTYIYINKYIQKARYRACASAYIGGMLNV